jgi:2-dehydro-3-deoxyphosphogluconate aldolase/(4S)-4-hydroxy-2-oxoglutarate aldolase
MDMYPIVRAHPVLAILRNVPLESTLDYAQAVVDGGISFFEVALNSPDGLAQITLLRKQYGDRCLIGAGTATTLERCRRALDAGAQFLLTPGTPADVLEYCAAHDVSLLPGVATPCDVAAAEEFGFHTLKLFPAGLLPHGYVKALKGPFSESNYMAIGGVSPDNIGYFFAEGCISVGLASNLIPPAAAGAGDWEAAAASIRQLVEKVKTFRA